NYLAPLRGSQSPFHRIAGLSSARAIAIGFDHQCVLRGDRRVACWGTNRDGQTGQPPPRLSPPVLVRGLPSLDGALVAGWKQTCLVGSGAAELYCWGGYRAAPLRIDGGRFDGSVVELALAEAACLRTDQSTVQCYGDSWFDGTSGPSGSYQPLVPR